MSIIKLKKGLDIKLKGKPKEEIKELPLSDFYAVKPIDFKNLTPKIVKKAGQKVKAGSVIFQDKHNSKIVFTAPVSGELTEIKRGERRKILEFIIKTDQNIQYEQFKKGSINDFSKQEIKNQIIKSGLWTKIIKRPFGIIANPEQTPKALHISTFDTAPLSQNYNFTLKNSIEDFQTGVNFLNKLTDNKVHLNINANIKNNFFENIKNAKINEFSGKHPTGNVGIQIHHTTPIIKGETVWTINPQDVVFIGRLFSKGILDLTKIIALAGNEVKKPRYYKIITGDKISNIIKNNIKKDNVRYISGNVLSGRKVDKNSFIGAFDNLLTVITEGDYYEMFGWAKPGFNKYSVHKAFFSWLRPNKRWELDTNYHGGLRTFVLTGKMEKVLPMKILPMQLLKACIAEDIDMMENLGIYEIIEEDIALCEFISETKMDFQEIINNAIKLMIQETE